MRLLRTLVLLLCLPLAAAWPSQAARPGATELAYERATTAFRAQRYAAAYGLYTRLADAGHAPSARLALVMHDHGASLFDREWYASPDQQRRWNALVANAARVRAVADEAGAGD